MNRTILRILRYEVVTHLTRPAYLIFGFGIPLLSFLVISGLNLITAGGEASEEPGEAVPAEEGGLKPQGYVDEAGLIQALPPDLLPGILQPYADEAAAQQALEAGEIGAYTLIPADFVESGRVQHVMLEYSPLAEGGTQDWMIRWTLLYNLTGGDEQLARLAWDPTPRLQSTDLSQLAESAGGEGLSGDCPAPGMTCNSSVFLTYLPLAVMIIFFITLMNSGSLILSNISSEKENRVMEVLLVSVSPRQLLIGKLLGGVLLGIAQSVAWLAAVRYASNQGGQLFNLPPGYQFPASLLGWGIAFFLLGYAIYASLMAAAGALNPSMKAYSGVTMVVCSPLFTGYMLSSMLGPDPHGWLSTALSIFPLTAPVSMLWRLVHGGVPAWQPPLATGLMLATAALIVPAAARAFRAQALLSGEPFKVGRLLRALWRG